MAKQEFPDRLYESIEIIQAHFRVHQSTILQLSARYKVGQEKMRQFLKKTLGEEYQEIVKELREMVHDESRRNIFGHVLKNRLSSRPVCPVVRTKIDFSEVELKELQRKIEARRVEPQVSYHPYIVNPLQGDL